MSTPAELYRNAIDLNRYSNSVAKRIIVSYNDLLVDTAQRLAGLDAVSAPAKAARLRATLGQLKTSLNEWASNSTALSVRELEELAGVQAGFVEEQLREAIPLEFRNQVRSVEISPRFAEAVATADPTQQGIVSLSDDLEAAVKGAKDVVRIKVADGVTMTLPNGQVLKNSFANMAQKEAAFFGQAVRNGFLTGEPTDSIIRRLKGRLTEGDAGPISQILRAGGESTVRANNQIRTLVRTSVNQVANAASMKTYEANQDITTKYRYTATLDSRTSPVCRALDGTEHLYGKGPIPPQHFNCRSTTVPIVDYEKLGFNPPPPSKLGRPNGDKNIPDGENYGPWLKRQPKAVQEKVLGDKGQVDYFNALSRKYDPDVAIRRFVREDGSEKTIGDLKKAYGDPSKIKAKPKAKPKPKVPPKPKPQPAPPKQTLAKPKAETFTPLEKLTNEQIVSELEKKWDIPVPRGLRDERQLLADQLADMRGVARLGSSRLDQIDELIEKNKSLVSVRKPRIVSGNTRLSREFNDAETVLGKGAFGEARLTSKGDVIKSGAIGQDEVKAMQRLERSGISPVLKDAEAHTDLVLGGGREADGASAFIGKYDGMLKMSRAKGQSMLDYVLDGEEKTTGLAESFLRSSKKMHLQGVAHNDRHMGNIFVYDKKVSFLDFGLAQTDSRAALVEALGNNDPVFDRQGGDLFLTNNLGKSSVWQAFRKNKASVISKLKASGKGSRLLKKEIRTSGETFSELISEKEAQALLVELYEGI